MDSPDTSIGLDIDHVETPSPRNSLVLARAIPGSGGTSSGAGSSVRTPLTAAAAGALAAVGAWRWWHGRQDT